MCANNLAAVLADRIGDKYTNQCLNFECELKIFLDNLEHYSKVLYVRLLNLAKTEALWSTRAIGLPKFGISLADAKTNWVDEFEDRDYLVILNIHWSTMVNKTLIKKKWIKTFMKIMN